MSYAIVIDPKTSTTKKIMDDVQQIFISSNKDIYYKTYGIIFNDKIRTDILPEIIEDGHVYTLESVSLRSKVYVNKDLGKYLSVIYRNIIIGIDDINSDSVVFWNYSFRDNAIFIGDRKIFDSVSNVSWLNFGNNTRYFVSFFGDDNLYIFKDGKIKLYLVGYKIVGNCFVKICTGIFGGSQKNHQKMMQGDIRVTCIN